MSAKTFEGSYFSYSENVDGAYGCLLPHVAVLLLFQAIEEIFQYRMLREVNLKMPCVVKMSHKFYIGELRFVESDFLVDYRGQYCLQRGHAQNNSPRHDTLQ